MIHPFLNTVAVFTTAAALILLSNTIVDPDRFELPDVLNASQRMLVLSFDNRPASESDTRGVFWATSIEARSLADTDGDTRITLESDEGVFVRRSL